MPKAPTLNRWYTTKDAADILGCSISNVWQLIHRGKMPNVVKVGRSLLIPEPDLKKVKKYQEERKALIERGKTMFFVPKKI